MSVQPPRSCNALAVIDSHDGHCWVLVYLPHRISEDVDQLCRYLNCILTEHRSVTIIGDFNMADIKWASSAKSQQLDVIHQKFYQFCSSWDLQEMVQKPTQKQNYLDIILTKHPERYGELYVKPPLLNSNHDSVICHIKQPAQRNRATRHEKNFFMVDYNAIAQYLSKCQWHNIFANCHSVDDYWLALYKLLRELIEMFVTVQTKRQGGCGLANVNRHLSLPRAIRKLLLLKRRAWRRWRLNRTAPNKAFFNMASRLCSTDIRRYLENQELRLLDVGSRKFFAYTAR